jgi:lipid-binding SYLF domain-containing protein
MKFRFIGSLMGVLCLSIALCLTASAQDTAQERRKAAEDAEKQANKAATVFREIMGTPDKGIPATVLDKAYCVGVFPAVIKGGFVVGGRYGRGVASCRTKVGWSAPGFFTLGGGSFGLQIGAQATDFILLFMNEAGVDGLLKTRFEIGGEASGAAGPVGRQAGAATDVMLKSPILSYSRSKGLFGGLELKGSMINQDGDNNRAIYGNTPIADVMKGARPAPTSVKVFPNTLARFSKRRNMLAQPTPTPTPAKRP